VLEAFDIDIDINIALSLVCASGKIFRYWEIAIASADLRVRFKQVESSSPIIRRQYLNVGGKKAPVIPIDSSTGKLIIDKEKETLEFPFLSR
jgi:hypothetical protein